MCDRSVAGRSGWRRSRALVGVALVLATGAVVVAASSGNDRRGTPVLVATSPLGAGDLLSEALDAGSARWVDVPLPDGVAGFVDPAAVAQGARLAVGIGAREPVTAAAAGGYGGARVGPGQRLISLPLSAGGAVSGALVPGARVDVLSTLAEGPLASTGVVAEAATVVRVVIDGQGADGIVLRVAARDALAVTDALSGGGEVRLAVRPRRGSDVP
jgi:Flp pilus assembly protein CpaB